MNKKTNKITICIVVLAILGLYLHSCVKLSWEPQVSLAAEPISDFRQVKIPVYILIYGVPPISLDWEIEEIIDYLERGTMYHNSGEPYLDFEIYKSATAKPYVIPTMPDSYLADYQAIYFDNGVENLCQLAQEGKIKQVWVWGNGVGGHMMESVDIGPLWHNTFDTNVPDCGVQLVTVGNNWTMPVGNAIEAHVHRYEMFFNYRFTYAFNKQSAIPYQKPSTQCPGSDPGDYWGWCVEDFVAGHYSVKDASTNGYTKGALDENDIAACGWAHYPPNITWEYRQIHGDASRYVYDYMGSIHSTCRNWRLDVNPAEIVEEINCTAWGCDIPGNNNHAEYFVWWMQNIPGPNNVNFDEQGNLMPNWWAELYAE
jgi:hypothetical protein